MDTSVHVKSYLHNAKSGAHAAALHVQDMNSRQNHINQSGGYPTFPTNSRLADDQSINHTNARNTTSLLTSLANNQRAADTIGTIRSGGRKPRKKNKNKKTRKRRRKSNRFVTSRK